MKKLVPQVTSDQMRRIDKLMTEEYKITLIQMMENAGRNLAELVRRRLDGSVAHKRVVVASGRGNNGGGGLVSARHLYNWGGNVTLLIPDSDLKTIPKKQLNILEKLRVSIKRGEEGVDYLQIAKPDVVVDALIGYGLSGNPRGWVREVIEGINNLKAPIISYDAPSGLDSTTGEVYTPCVNASATLTLALPKTGLSNKKARSVSGELYLGDISMPPDLYREFGLNDSNLFEECANVKMKEMDGEMSV
jgi:NAD(P)H-hydrate epimerase